MFEITFNITEKDNKPEIENLINPNDQRTYRKVYYQKNKKRIIEYLAYYREYYAQKKIKK